MLFKISANNIRKSLRDYTIYFFTLIIGVSIFYVFNAIDSQTAFMKVSSDTRQVIDLLKQMISVVSVFVSVVLGLLIVYASRFLMKRRNKEFALYLMLGMGKKKISAILLFETIIIGIGSLLVGLLIGVGLSQVMSALVANLFEADMSSYKFTVSSSAIIKTIIYFSVTYVVVMLFNSVMISKCKLIDLIQSGKKSEKLKLKNPILCVIIFIISCCALGYAYYRTGFKTMELQDKELVILITIGAVTTFLIFWSVSGLLLRIIMSMKGAYHRGLNSFTFRQISSKVNTTVMSMTVICLMLFVTICTLSGAFSIRNSMNANIKKFCPADFELTYNERYENEDNPHSVDVLQKGKDYGFDLTQDFSDYIHFHSYADANFTFETFLGDKFEQTKADNIFMVYDTTECIVKLSDYNKLMVLYGKDKLALNDNEYILLCDFNNVTKIRNNVLKDGKDITVFGHTLKSKYKECRDGFIDLSSLQMNMGIFVVPDSVVDESFADTDYVIGNYATETKDEKQEIEEKTRKKFDKFIKTDTDNQEDNASVYFSYNTKIDIATSSVGLGAMVTFLGLYIGLIFLICCAAILALKELSESVDSIPRYEILRKIGVEEKDISRSLFRQTGIFFLLPLLLACIHSIFGLKFAKVILDFFGTDHLMQSILSTCGIILLIYGGYFLITYFCSKSIIKGNK